MGRIALLFPGQGAQSVGMGRELADSIPTARRLYDDAAEILGFDLAKLCFEGPAEELDSTVFSQPGLFVTSLAALESLRQESPDVALSAEAAAGLSLGEYTAMVFAGVMDFETGLRVVQQRGQAMQAAADATPSGMVSILGPERVQVETMCDEARQGETLQIANLLCPGNTVVSGTNTACERIADVIERSGAAKAVPLPVAGAFHTPIMGPAVERLKAALSNAKLRRATIPVISNVDGQPHQDAEEIRELLIKQVVELVRWEDSMRYLVGEGFNQFYEVGPGRVLRGLLRRVDRSVSCQSVSV